MAYQNYGRIIGHNEGIVFEDNDLMLHLDINLAMLTYDIGLESHQGNIGVVSDILFRNKAYDIIKNAVKQIYEREYNKT